MSKEFPPKEAAIVIPTGVTFTADKVQVSTVTIGTSIDAALRRGEKVARDIASQGIEGVLSQGSKGRTSSSHAMPGRRWSPTAWKPTGPDLEWQRRLREKQDDPEQS